MDYRYLGQDELLDCHGPCEGEETGETVTISGGFSEWWESSPFAKSWFPARQRIAAFAAWVSAAELMQRSGIGKEDREDIVSKVVTAIEVGLDKANGIRKEVRDELYGELMGGVLSMQSINDPDTGGERAEGFHHACEALLVLLGGSPDTDLSDLGMSFVPSIDDYVSAESKMGGIDIGNGMTVGESVMAREEAIHKGEMPSVIGHLDTLMSVEAPDGYVGSRYVPGSSPRFDPKTGKINLPDK